MMQYVCRWRHCSVNQCSDCAVMRRGGVGFLYQEVQALVWVCDWLVPAWLCNCDGPESPLKMFSHDTIAKSVSKAVIEAGAEEGRMLLHNNMFRGIGLGGQLILPCKISCVYITILLLFCFVNVSMDISICLSVCLSVCLSLSLSHTHTTTRKKARKKQRSLPLCGANT